MALGGHVAEKLVIGREKISSGCSSDLEGATKYATAAVSHWGMYGDNVSFISKDKTKTSDVLNSKIDQEVQTILDESFERVKDILTTHDKQLRELAKQLYLHDYLDADEMDRIISGRGLDPEKTKKVRDWEKEDYLIKF